MVRCLLALLLILGLALPAVATPLHCVAMPAANVAAHQQHHAAKSQSDMAPAVAGQNDCIGCAALSTPAPPLADRLFEAVVRQATAKRAALEGQRATPETPPPRGQS